MASIRKNGNGWQVRYYADGIQQHEQFESIGEAETRRAEIALNKTRGITTESKPNTVQFWELAAAVITHYKVNKLPYHDSAEQKYRLHLDPFFGRRKAVAINPSHINKYVEIRQTAGASNGEIQRELELLKRAFKLGLEQKTVASMPHIQKLKEAPPREGFFTREQLDAVCRLLPIEISDFVTFAFLCGFRRGEIVKLKWSMVDLDRRQIQLPPGKTKNGKSRTFPITDELMEILERRSTADRFKQAQVFTRNSKPIGSFRKRWARACMKAGMPCELVTEKYIAKRGPKKGQTLIRVKAIVKGALVHDLRRSAARELGKILGEKRAMVRTGHLTRSVFDRYTSGAELEVDLDRELLEKANMARIKAKMDPKKSGGPTSL